MFVTVILKDKIVFISKHDFVYLLLDLSQFSIILS